MDTTATDLRRAPATFLGIQSGFGLVPDFPLYNLTADVDGHPAGSTVSGETLERAGFFLAASVGDFATGDIRDTRMAPALKTVENYPRLLVFLAVAPHPAGGWTHAEPVDATISTKRIYRGWWSTRGAAKRALNSKFSSRA